MAKGTKGAPQISIAPPPAQKPANSSKGSPTALPASTNLSKAPSSELVAMNFKVPAEFRREFKLEATARDMDMVELFQQAYECWKKYNQ